MQLIPLFATIGIASALAAAYTFRLATQSHDVVWNAKNPYPWVTIPQTQNAHVSESRRLLLWLSCVRDDDDDAMYVGCLFVVVLIYESMMLCVLQLDLLLS